MCGGWVEAQSVLGTVRRHFGLRVSSFVFLPFSGEGKEALGNWCGVEELE
jgi:hypothetical protein